MKQLPTVLELDDPKVFFKKGVKPVRIDQQPMPKPEDRVATQVASEVIRVLDRAGYSREQVHAIAKWVQYLSTQA